MRPPKRSAEEDFDGLGMDKQQRVS